MGPRTKATGLDRAETVLLASSPTLAGLTSGLLSLGATVRFQAAGSSMHPFIREGDVITLQPLSGHRPRWGDVVAFVHPHTARLTVHRVVGTKGGLFMIKGDAASRPDTSVPGTEILGRVASIERNKKRIFFSLGPERLVIALLSRCRLMFRGFRSLNSCARRLLRTFCR